MKKILLALLGVLVISSMPLTAHADVNDFVITNFNSDQTLSNNDPQGELHIVEHIDVLFTDNNHGLLRAIPESYKGNSLKLHVNSISSTTGAPTSYTTYSSNGNTVLKIGNPSQTVTGSQSYVIDYTLKNVITFYKDHDELYWDVNGDQWGQTFLHVSATVHLPEALKPVKMPVCFTGSYGSQVSNCTVDNTANSFTVTTTQSLEGSQTLTYVAGFSTGYFKPMPWYQQAIQKYGAFAEFLIIAGGIALTSFVLWFRRGRDAKGTGVIIPQYGPPEGLGPMQVGVIVDFKMNGTEMTATIIDLAIRGYIKIIETKQNRPLMKDKTVYSLELHKTDQALSANESKVISALFSSTTPGTTVDIASQKNKLYTTMTSISNDVEDQLTSDGYFRGNPLKSGKSIGAVLGIIAMVLGLLYLIGFFVGWPIIGGLIVGGIIAAIFGQFMAARSAKGVAAKEYIEGLKLYMNVAEKDRIAKLQAPDAPYAANAHEPVKTVELFEKLLPYAIVLGVEKQWAGQFESLYTQPPSWYSGNWSTFNAIYLTNSVMSGLNQSVNTAFSAPSSSSSSGFGGGGFSGGGGGGGGGGGW